MTLRYNYTRPVTIGILGSEIPKGPQVVHEKATFTGPAAVRQSTRARMLVYPLHALRFIDGNIPRRTFNIGYMPAGSAVTIN